MSEKTITLFESANNFKICLILINYYSASDTIKCLQALLLEPLQTIYVLDNSEDINEEILLKKFIEEYSKNKNIISIIFLSFKENLGFSKGVNTVLDYDSTTENKHTHYCLLNNDTIASRGFVEPLVKQLNDRSIALVSPKIRWGEETIRYRYYDPFLAINSLVSFPFSFPYLSGCCLMFRQDLLCNKKLFDEDFFMYGEDIELSWRVSKEGKKLKVVEDSVILHKGSLSSIKGSYFYEYYLVRTHMLLVNKMYQKVSKKIISYTGKSIFLLLRALVRAIRNKNLIPLKAYFMCWSDYKVRPKIGGE